MKQKRKGNEGGFKKKCLYSIWIEILLKNDTLSIGNYAFIRFICHLPSSSIHSVHSISLYLTYFFEYNITPERQERP